MIAFLTAVLAVSGSERAALTNLYLLPIITAALALGRRHLQAARLAVVVEIPPEAQVRADPDRLR